MLAESIQQRLIKYIDDVVFDVIRKSCPKQFEKIKFIEGDVGSDSLVFSASDHDELMQKVNIIFHCAATVSFSESLKTAININTAGTKRLLDLAINVKNLQAFVYISTAFSHCYQTDLEERFYDTKLDPSLIMKQVNEMNNDELKALQNET
jgi:alcohol-forming fatty acyl-CoA reductase